MQRIIRALRVVTSAWRFAFVYMFQELSRFNFMVFVKWTFKICLEITHTLTSVFCYYLFASIESLTGIIFIKASIDLLFSE